MPAPEEVDLKALQRIFGYRVRELRDERGMAQAALAEAAGLHTTYMSNIESGHRNPSLGTIVKLARALGVPAGALMPTD